MVVHRYPGYTIVTQQAICLDQFMKEVCLFFTLLAITAIGTILSLTVSSIIALHLSFGSMILSTIIGIPYLLKRFITELFRKDTNSILALIDGEVPTA